MDTVRERRGCTHLCNLCRCSGVCHSRAPRGAFQSPSQVPTGRDACSCRAFARRARLHTRPAQLHGPEPFEGVRADVEFLQTCRSIIQNGGQAVLVGDVRIKCGQLLQDSSAYSHTPPAAAVTTKKDQPIHLCRSLACLPVVDLVTVQPTDCPCTIQAICPVWSGSFIRLFGYIPPAPCRVPGDLPGLDLILPLPTQLTRLSSFASLSTCPAGELPFPHNQRHRSRL
jgi:hypothetical protein